MPYSSRFDEALIYTHQLHREQIRKGSQTPYINHLLAVASIVGEHGGSEDQVIAALLHDAIEDQGGKDTGLAIRERFGPAVADIVEACTDTDTAPKPPWRPRKEAYLHHLRTVSRDALLVSAADKLHNARSILTDLRSSGPGVWNLFAGGRDGTLWYYRSLVTVHKSLWNHPVVDELDFVVSELERVVQSDS